MVTYLDLLNRARAEQSLSPLTTLEAQSSTSADAVLGRAILSKVIALIHENSFDADFSEKLFQVTTTPGVALINPPAAPNEWNPQIVNRVQYQKDANSIVDLILIPFERAKDIEVFTSTSSGAPIWYYVNNGQLYVLPIPQAAYDLRIFYQGLVPTVTPSNITSTVNIPRDFENTFVDGIYAFLRRDAADPDWRQDKTTFLASLKRSFVRNKYLYKNAGGRQFRMKRSNPDRRF